MSAAPLVSIVTVVYNGASVIASTVSSVLSQSYGLIEYIVIDGASTDGTLDILKSYSDRIDILVSEPDEGIYDAMNKGLRVARGDYVLFMNCGDLFFDRNSVANAVNHINPSREQVLLGRWVRRTTDNKHKLCRPDISRGLFNHQAILYSKSIHAWHGEYLTVNGLTAADYVFFATLFKSSRVDCMEIDCNLSTIDIDGASSGLQTVSQKYSLDFLLGRIGKTKLVLVLALHPFYYKIKKLLGLRS